MLSADEVRQLDRLTFGNAGACPASALPGARIARTRGFGTEFRDFRPYQHGDDPRAIEWTVYGRLRQLVTRTYSADVQLHVHLLVDVSASMSVGVPGKLACAARVAALLGYAGLRTRDAVALATFNDRVAQRIVPAAGRAQLFRIFAALRSVAAAGPSAIGAALADYAALERGPGLAVVISDFFDPAGVLNGLRYLLHRALTPAVVQIVSDAELEPPIHGDVELVDVENPETPALRVDPAVLSSYRAAMDHHRADLAGFCAAHGLPVLQFRSSSSFSELLEGCSRAGLFITRR